MPRKTATGDAQKTADAVATILAFFRTASLETALLVQSLVNAEVGARVSASNAAKARAKKAKPAAAPSAPKPRKARKPRKQTAAGLPAQSAAQVNQVLGDPADSETVDDLEPAEV